MDSAREPSPTEGFLLALEFGVSCLAFPLALFLECHPPKEMLECIVQVSKRFLHGTFRHFVGPEDFRFLQGIDLAV